MDFKPAINNAAKMLLEAKGFDWQTSFCSSCDSKARIVLAQCSHPMVQCAVCGEFIGWLPEKMPYEVALEIRLQCGQKHANKKIKDIPRDYLHWLFYTDFKKEKVQEMALEAIVDYDGGKQCTSTHI